MNKHLRSIKQTAVLVAVSWLAMPAFAGLGGFIDAQVGGSKDVNLNSEIADGAIYLSKEMGRGKMMIDVPFSFRASNITETGQTGFATGFRSFNTKAQAYVNWSYDFGLSWQLGRFDSPFLNEANDTVGLGPYATQGVVFGILPRMHNGLMLTYGQGPITVMGIASRADGVATAKADGERFEWGVLGKYTHEMMYVGAGLYLHKPGTGTTAENQSIIEVMAGTKLGDWTVDAQAVFTKVASPSADSGLGLGATINYAFDKTWTFGIRPNYINKTPTSDTQNGSGNTFELTVGPHMSLTDDMKVRVNYTYTSEKSDANAKATTDSAYTLSAVYKF